MSLLLCVAIVSCVENDNNVLDDGNKETDNTEATVEVEEEAPGLSELRKSILDSGNTLGVAYLGYNEGTFSDVKEYFGEIALYEEYPFVKNMELDRYCVTGGDEHYLVVPADKEASVKVYIGVPNLETYNIDKGELVFEAADGNPIIIRGNESEIFSNIVVVCNDVEYTLYLSGEDGRLAGNESIYDFSRYEDIKEYFGISSDDISNVPEQGMEDNSYLQGMWGKISERVETYLELLDDGSANFDHTDIDGNEISCRGTWSADGLTLFLDLYDSEDNAKLIYSGEYGIMYDGEMLTLSHFDGDALTDFMAEYGYDSFIYYSVG